MFFRRQLQPVASSVTAPIIWDDTDTVANTIDTLARTIWGEARGETLAGKEAVANVVMNRLKTARARGKFWWGNSIQDICRKPYQFSCWNDNDINRAKMLRVAEDDAQFTICLRIARRAVNGLLPDHVGGADHYHTENMTPSWAESRIPCAIIGAHLFYRLEA